MSLGIHFSMQNGSPFTFFNSKLLSRSNGVLYFENKRKRKNCRCLHIPSTLISCSSIKPVRDRPLDRHVVKKNRIRFVQKLKTLLLSKPKHYIRIHILSKCRSYLTLPKHQSLLSMIKRYPSIFELFSIPYPPTPMNATKQDPQLCVRLTSAAAALAAEELKLKSSDNLAIKLQKLLMLSSHRRLLLSKLVHLAPDLGLPPNFRSRLCNDHPDKFKTLETSYGRALELVRWDPELANPLPSLSRPPDFIVERPLKFKQLRLRKGLNLKRRHQDFLIKFQEMQDMNPYGVSVAELAKESIAAEKRSCAVVREVLGMTVEKWTLIDHLTHFRKEFGLPNKLRGMIMRHPEMFYVSLKGQRDSIFLVEGYDEKGELLEKDPTLVIKKKWMQLTMESKRLRRERRKDRTGNNVSNYSDESDENGRDADSDDDDGDYEIDNFSDAYDDGFETLFLDSELEDEEYDVTDEKLSSNGSTQFWVADLPCTPNGFDDGLRKPW